MVDRIVMSVFAAGAAMVLCLAVWLASTNLAVAVILGIGLTVFTAVFLIDLMWRNTE